MTQDLQDEKPKRRKITVQVEVGDNVNGPDGEEIEIVGTFEDVILGRVKGEQELIEVEGVQLY